MRSPRPMASELFMILNLLHESINILVCMHTRVKMRGKRPSHFSRKMNFGG